MLACLDGYMNIAMEQTEVRCDIHGLWTCHGFEGISFKVNGLMFSRGFIKRLLSCIELLALYIESRNVCIKQWSSFLTRVIALLMDTNWYVSCRNM